MREYYGKTLFELDLELAGYNRRWEEAWKRERVHLVQRYNETAPKGKKKKDFELMPLPSDEEKIANKLRMEKLKGKVRAELGVKTI